MNTRGSWLLVLPCALLLVSGAAALVLEAVWFHQAALALGSDVLASAAVLGAFMGGMALGGVLAPRLVRNARSPLITYALLEGAVAVLGLLAVAVLPTLGTALAPLLLQLEGSPTLVLALRVGVALVTLGLPAVAMGATVPVLLAAIAPGVVGFGRALGFLYGVNTLGAAGGVLAAELLLVPRLGITGSALLAAALCVGIALIAVNVAVVTPPRGVPSPTPPVVEGTRRLLGQSYPLLLAAALSGFALLALEVVWFRFLSLVLNSTPLAFAVVLATVLVGIALGGALAGALAGLLARARSLGFSVAASVAAFATGAAGLFGYSVYGALVQGSFRFEQGVATVLMVCAPLVLPPAVLSGAVYAWIGAALRQALAHDAAADVREDARAAGALGCANTTGAMLGSLVGGLVLLPNAGMERALVGLCASYGAVGVLLALGLPGEQPASRTLRVARAVGPALLVLALLSFPFGDVRERFITAAAERWMSGQDRIVSVVEARTGTLIHIEHRRDGLAVFDQIATDAFSMTVDDFAARRYMKLYAYLPSALHPKLERALVIGYGLGSTAQAVLDNPDVEHLDVVDTEPRLVQLAREISARKGKDPLDDPRAALHVADGRHFVQLRVSSGDPGYDLITGEPPPPIIAGVSSLYTREYFELLSRALRPGGMVSYWLPMMNLSAASGRAIVRAFCDAFDDCSLWHGSGRNFMLLGSRPAPGERTPVSVDRYTRTFRIGSLRLELTGIGFESPAQLGTLFIGDAAYLQRLTARDEPLTDDFPRRLSQPGTTIEREALIWQFRDTGAARKRFEQSAFIAQVIPADQQRETMRHFEDQRLYNDLILSPRTAARQVGVLGQVLERTQLVLPALLILGSDSDVQAAMRRLDRAQLEAPELLVHRVSAALVARNYDAARRLMMRLPDERLPLPGLREYVEQAATRAP